MDVSLNRLLWKLSESLLVQPADRPTRFDIFFTNTRPQNMVEHLKRPLKVLIRGFLLTMAPLRSKTHSLHDPHPLSHTSP